MELRHIRYFVAVAEALNFRQAALNLHISGPTLSKQIMDLEEYLGASLFERTTRQVALTIPGEVFLIHARSILAQAMLARQQVHDATQGKLGTLKVGNAGALSHSFMPSTLSTFRKTHPDVDVVLVETDIEKQVAAVINGSLHIGFHVEGMEALPSDVNHFTILKTNFQVVHGSEHRFAKLSEIRPADLKTEKIMSFNHSANSLHERFIADILLADGVEIGSVKVLNSYDAFLTMIAGGDGISLLPRIGNLPILDGIIAKPLKDSAAEKSFNVSVIWKKHAQVIQVTRFVDALKAVKQKLISQ